jgi:uncharacterized protein YndB with AHSA1/START domain
MMRLRTAFSVLLVSTVPVLVSGPAPAQTGSGGAAPYKEIPTVCLEAQATIAASPAQIWAYVTTGKNFATWCPMWKSPANAKISLTKVGDTVSFTDQWGNGGRSIVTYVEKDKQLRVAHEPNDGSYMCQSKLTLMPQGKGTMVHYSEMYTDASAPADVAATAGKMNAEIGQSLQAMKAALEKK